VDWDDGMIARAAICNKLQTYGRKIPASLKEVGRNPGGTNSEQKGTVPEGYKFIPVVVLQNGAVPSHTEQLLWRLARRKVEREQIATRPSLLVKKWIRKIALGVVGCVKRARLEFHSLRDMLYPAWIRRASAK